MTQHIDRAVRRATRGLAFAFLLVLGAGPTASAADSQPPNILFIFADDLGWADIAGGQTTYGGGTDFYETPNITRLAREGMAFSSAYACPNCAPTRGALHSGQYPPRTRIYNVGSLNRGNGTPKLVGPDQHEDVPAELSTLAETLKGGGYVTAHVGKYHIGGHEGGEATLPLNQGLDYNYGGGSAGNPGRYFAKETEPGVWSFHNNVGPELDVFAAPYDAAYAAAYRVGAEPDYRLPESLYGTPKHVGDAVADAALEFMEMQRLSGKPFFVEFHDYLVHTPLQGRPDLEAKYREKQASAPGSMGHEKHPDYAAMVGQLDLSVGRLMAYLDDPNNDGDPSDSIAKDTLVIFSSDNGGHRGSTVNTPLRGAKGMFTEGGIRVPLIARMPGTIPAGTTNDTPVIVVDMYPTLADYARADLPDPAAQPLDGVSLRPLFEGRAASLPPRNLYWHFPGYLDDRAQPTSVVIGEVDGKRYKLLYFYETGDWSLYNLTDDLGESRDLLAEETPGAAALRIQALLGADLRAWLDATGAIYPAERDSGNPVPPPVLP